MGLTDGTPHCKIKYHAGYAGPCKLVVKAAAIAKVARQSQVILVSSSLASMSLSGVEHQPTIDTALDAAFERLGAGAGVLRPRELILLPGNPSKTCSS